MSTESDDEKEGGRLIKKLKDELAKPGEPLQVGQPDKWADAPSRPSHPPSSKDDSAKKP